MNFRKIITSTGGIFLGPGIYALFLLLYLPGVPKNNEFINFWAFSKIVSTVQLLGFERHTYKYYNFESKPDTFFKYLYKNLPLLKKSLIVTLIAIIISSILEFDLLYILVTITIFSIIEVLGNAIKATEELIFNQFILFGATPIFLVVINTLIENIFLSTILAGFFTILVGIAILMYFNRKRKQGKSSLQVTLQPSNSFIYTTTLNNVIHRLKSGNDLIFYEYFGSNSEMILGYLIANKFVAFTGIPLTIMNSIFTNQIRELNTKSFGRYYRSNRIFSFLGSSAVALLLLIITLTNFYEINPVYLSLLIIGSLINSFFGGVNLILAFSGNEKFLAKTNLVIIVLVIPLYIILISQFEVIGLILSNLSITIINNVLNYYFYKTKVLK